MSAVQGIMPQPQPAGTRLEPWQRRPHAPEGQTGAQPGLERHLPSPHPGNTCWIRAGSDAHSHLQFGFSLTWLRGTPLKCPFPASGCLIPLSLPSPAAGARLCRLLGVGAGCVRSRGRMLWVLLLKTESDPETFLDRLMRKCLRLHQEAAPCLEKAHGSECEEPSLMTTQGTGEESREPALHSDITSLSAIGRNPACPALVPGEWEGTSGACSVSASASQRVSLSQQEATEGASALTAADGQKEAKSTQLAGTWLGAAPHISPVLC